MGIVKAYSEMIKEFIEKNRDRKTFLEHEAKGLLKDSGFAVPEGIFIKKGDGSPAIAGLRYPLVAKVSSTRITSKSDVHGVRINIRAEDELDRAVNELMQIENAEGVLVEEMSLPGLEVIVGGIIDKQFGPVMMFGLGGIFVEIFKDISFGLAPLTEEDALRLIRQVKGYRLLEGYRGRSAVDKEALLKVLVSVSEMMATNLIGEIDLNPVALYPEGAIILDAKMKAL